MGNTKHILVIRFSAMGDVALTIPALLSVVQFHPDVHITIITRPFYASFIPDHPRIKAIGVDLNDYKGLLGLRKLTKKLTNEHQIDEVVDLHNVVRSRIITSFFKLKGKKVTTLNKNRSEKKKIISHQSTEQLPHVTEQYLNTFAKAGYKTQLTEGPWLHPTEKPQLTEFLTKNNLNTKGNKWIGVAPFAAHEAKMWGIDNINNLITELIQKGYSVFLFGGGDSEVEQLDKLENKENRVYSVAGKMNFDQEIALMKKLDFLVCMDSSNMHFGTLVGTTVISIWGATTPLIGFFPLDSQDLMLQVPENDRNKLTLSKYGNKKAENGYDWREAISMDEILSFIS
ncbi:glycosyltransferase family 9 protein [Flavobacteriales bacterium]|nr:glycosyltransferase family 9 protein [Flavobacteriales bacterium]